MKAAILTIGDELTCGYQLDTNAQFIARHLTTLPADIVLHMSVGDDVDAIRAALRVALRAVDVLIVAGGLGPTEDDLTRQAIAAHFGVALVENPQALAHIQERFTHRDLEMPKNNRTQAHVPAGSQIIHNSRGTAAGFYLRLKGNRHLFATPGVPYEMEGMLSDYIVPRLQEVVGAGTCVRRAFVRVYGLPESEINQRIRPMLDRARNPLLGLLPDRGTITIEIVATGKAAEESEALIDADMAALRTELGDAIISEDGRELPEVVSALLTERAMTIAVAELGTGGLVAARITEISGAERWFKGATIVTDSDGLGEPGALVSTLAAREATIADIGVGVGPIVVPEDSEPTNPYGMVDVAVNARGREHYERLRFNGTLTRVREWAADGTLAMVRRVLLEL
jgi:nicotinamide-nucleotide amidase